MTMTTYEKQKIKNSLWIKTKLNTKKKKKLGSVLIKEEKKFTYHTSHITAIHSQLNCC